MQDVKSIGELLGATKAEEARAVERTAVQNLWRQDFKGAPTWFLDKYFRNDVGQTCGRMHVKAYGLLGSVVTEEGKVLYKRNGKPLRLTTAYLAKRVEGDCAKAGYPDVAVHFKGYSDDDDAFAMSEPWSQEDFEENEARHVPGLDEDAPMAATNASAPLDVSLWESCAAFAMNALRAGTLMFWGLDEDFGRLMCASDFVHVSYNAYLRGLWTRISSMESMETLRFLESHDDYSMFDANDVVRTYTSAMRTLTGRERGERMFDFAWVLDPEVDAKALEAGFDAFSMGLGTRNVGVTKTALIGMVLANEDPTEEVADWDYEAVDGDLCDDDAGELATDLLLRY